MPNIKSKLKMATEQRKSQNVSEIANLESITRGIEQEIDKEKPDSHTTPLIIAEGLTKIFAAHQNDLHRAVTNQSFIDRKAEAQKEVANWSSLPLTKRIEKLDNATKYGDSIIAKLEKDLKGVPAYLRRDAILRFQSFYGQDLINVKKALHKEQAKILEAQIKLADDSIAATTRQNPDKAPTAISEALNLFSVRKDKQKKLAERFTKTAQLNAVRHIIDKGNAAELKAVAADKGVSQEARNEAKKNINAVESKSISDFDAAIKNPKTVEGLMSLSDKAINTGDVARKNLVVSLLNGIGNSYVAGASSLAPESIAEIRSKGKKLGYDETIISDIIQNATDLRFAHGGDLYERFTGKDFYMLSPLSRTKLGTNLIKSSDLHEVAAQIFKNPDNADELVKNLAWKAGTINKPGATWDQVLTFMTNNTNKTDHRSHNMISNIRSRRLAGYEGVLTIEQSLSVAANNDIPKGTFDVDEELLAQRYGANRDDVIDSIKTEVYYDMILKPGASHTLKDEDFKEAFYDEVSARAGDPRGWSEQIVDFFRGRSVQVPREVFYEWTEKQKASFRRAADGEIDTNNLDKKSQLLLEQSGAYTFLSRDKEGNLQAFAALDDENQTVSPLKTPAGTYLKASPEAIANGELDKVSEDMNNALNSLKAELIKTAPLGSGRDTSITRTNITSDIKAEDATTRALTEKYQRASGEYDTVKNMITQQLAISGLPAAFATPMAMQLILESGRLGKSLKNFDPKAVRTITLSTGRKVKITGYAQMTVDKAERFKRMGIDISTVSGSVKALIIHMKELMAQGLSKFEPKELKNKNALRGLYMYALKNYNGSGFDGAGTLRRGINKESSLAAPGSKRRSSLETNDYVSYIMGNLVDVSPSEMLGDSPLTKQRLKSIARKMGESLGDFNALKNLGFDYEGSRKYFKGGLNARFIKSLEGKHEVPR